MWSRVAKRRDCGGLTLLELTAVVAIIGIFASLAVTRFGHRAIGNAAAQGLASNLSLDLLQAQRRSISTGDNHFLEFHSTGGVVTGYTLRRQAAGGPIDTDTMRNVPRDVVLTVSHSRCEFNFEGTAEAACTLTVAGPDRQWIVEVNPATGGVRSHEL